MTKQKVVKPLNEKPSNTKMGVKIMGLHCNNCGKDVFDRPEDYFMLKNEVWNEVCEKLPCNTSYVLCKKCTEDALGRELTPEDYTDAPVNDHIFNPEPQITIEDLIPFIKCGWLAMDKDGAWWWHENKPKKYADFWDSSNPQYLSGAFNIKPATDWENSLSKIIK